MVTIHVQLTNMIRKYHNRIIVQGGFWTGLKRVMDALNKKLPRNQIGDHVTDFLISN